jgi:cytochrome P450
LSLPRTTLQDTLGVLVRIIAPTVAKGPIIRRPAMVALAGGLGLDRDAVRQMQALRNRYGEGPLMLAIPGPPRGVILAPEHVGRVLDETPEPFATETTEKRAALAHFEPNGVLISHGAEREERRRYNEAVLQSGCPVHQLGDRFKRVAEQEGALLVEKTLRRADLRWGEFAAAWFRMVRRVVLGDGARDDWELTREIDRLRKDANWAMLKPVRSHLRARFFQHLEQHLARAEAGSLAEQMAQSQATPLAHPTQQVPQWLFAFDAAGMATFRALALLATHPEHAQRARDEIAAGGTHPLPLLRATVLESVRLWPTTPMVLRQTTRETEWEAGLMPAGTGLLIYAPFFHRDDERLDFADRLAVELWLKNGVEDWPLIPFSRGPAVCPGRELVLFLSSVFLALILRSGVVRLASPHRIGPELRLPATLNHYALRFEMGG